jgi:hypothetical protein
VSVIDLQTKDNTGSEQGHVSVDVYPGEARDFESVLFKWISGLRPETTAKFVYVPDSFDEVAGAAAPGLPADAIPLFPPTRTLVGRTFGSRGNQAYAQVTLRITSTQSDSFRSFTPSAGTVRRCL